MLNISWLSASLFILFLAAFVLACIFYSLLRKLKKKLLLLKEENVQNQHEITKLAKEKLTLEITLENERKLMSEKVEWLRATQETLQQQFCKISNDIVKETAKEIREKHNEALNTSLTPLRTQLSDFKEKVNHVYEKESEQRIQLKQEILQLKSLNQQLSQDAINLSNALTGENKFQGLWGEVILERVLETSGLSSGREYDLQVALAGEENARLMPDAVIYLPDSRAVVVDAKVSLVAYQQAANEQNVTASQEFIKQHIKSIDTHIKNLSDKNYDAYITSKHLDFVLLFIPIEAAFLMALQHDDNLLERALKHNIMLVCPSTLLISLRTINNMWRFADQNQNAKEIANQAGSLYDKFVGFIEQLDKVGHELRQASNAYDIAYKQLVTGKGSLVNRAEKIRKLGANSKKRIQETILSEKSKHGSE